MRNRCFLLFCSMIARQLYVFISKVNFWAGAYSKRAGGGGLFQSLVFSANSDIKNDIISSIS